MTRKRKQVEDLHIDLVGNETNIGLRTMDEEVAKLCSTLLSEARGVAVQICGKLQKELDTLPAEVKSMSWSSAVQSSAAPAGDKSPVLGMSCGLGLRSQARHTAGKRCNAAQPGQHIFSTYGDASKDLHMFINPLGSAPRMANPWEEGLSANGTPIAWPPQLDDMHPAAYSNCDAIHAAFKRAGGAEQASVHNFTIRLKGGPQYELDQAQPLVQLPTHHHEHAISLLVKLRGTVDNMLALHHACLGSH